MRLAKQISVLTAVVLAFALFNFSAYELLTKRLSNNFGGASSAKMIDVGSYLPHSSESALPDIDSSLKLSGSLPVLDGAAALVPVYASVIDSVYPEGCVTFEGGEFRTTIFTARTSLPTAPCSTRTPSEVTRR